MSHDITVRADGRAEAVFALTPAWHGLGKVFDHAMSSAECLTDGGLAWRVAQRQVALKAPMLLGDVEVEVYQDVPGALANVREDTGLFLGFVSKQYKVVQNVEAFAFLDSLIENHEMQYESAFSLSGGKRVVLLGRLPEVDQIAKGDETLRYVLLGLHHDGTGAIRFGPTAVRVVCANTYALALDQGTIGNLDEDFSREAAIRHTGDVSAKLAAARNLLRKANDAFAQQAELSRELAKHRMTPVEWDQFLDLMCPVIDPRDPDWTEQRARKIDETRAAIRLEYINERNMMSGIEFSAWSAFNAVTEHIDHLPRRGATRQAKAEARFNVALYGPGRDMKKRAFEAACRFAGLSTSSAG